MSEPPGNSASTSLAATRPTRPRDGEACALLASRTSRGVSSGGSGETGADGRRGPTVTAWLLRLALTLQAVATVAQPMLIGGYLDGNFDLVGIHGGNGTGLLGWTLLAGLAASVRYWPGHGSAWPVPVLIVLWFGEGFQIGMGYERVMSAHVPLGVLIVGVSVGMAAWAWTRGARRPRRGWWR